MLRCWCVFLLLLSSSCAFADTKVNPQRPAPKQSSSHLPITTSSVEARKHFERAMRYFEEYRLPETLQDLRAATKIDPNFAQALIMIAKISKDPAEQSAARNRAKRLAPEVSPGERLLIQWLADAQEDDYLPAIAAMNDLLAKYPEDQRLAFMAGDWLTLQERYEQAAAVLNRALALL